MNFWQVEAKMVDGVEVLNVGVYGEIDPGIFSDGVASKAIHDSIQAHAAAKRISVRINSVGGDMFGGLAVYNSLRAHGAPVDVTVDGIAASAASIIAMAGHKVTMARGSMMMVHSPWIVTAGNAEDLRATADVLDKAREGLISIYQAKTGKSADELKSMLDAETWMTAEQAKAQGFADAVESAKPARARAEGDLVILNSVTFRRAQVPAAMLAAVEPAAAPVPVVPATPAGDTSMLTRNPLLLAAVGLPDDADEPTFDGRIESLAHFEREVCAKLGAAGPDEVLAKVTEAAAALVELPQLRAQIGAAQADSRKRDLRASLEGGLYARKLNLGTISRTLPRLVADPGKREQLRSALTAVKVTTRAGILDAACSVDLTDSDLDNVKDYIRDAPLVSPDPVREPSREGHELQNSREASAKLTAERMVKVDEELAADPNATPSVAWSRAAAKNKQLFADGVGVNPSEEK